MILILGRFQPLHKGHLKVIVDAASRDKDIVIAIGSPQKSDEKDNPFSAVERRGMIEAVLAANKLSAKVIEIPDIKSDEFYVRHVEDVVGAHADVIVTENPWTTRLFREAGYSVEVTPRYFGASATEVRRLMASGGDWKELVPKEVVRAISSIRGDERVKRLFSGTDK
jgi:nicotinamide-nucleotide adenylyltransferase